MHVRAIGSRMRTRVALFVAVAALSFRCTTSPTDNPSPPAPTVDLKANGSDGPVVTPYNTSATISWMRGSGRLSRGG